jgi:hypothetical protein
MPDISVQKRHSFRLSVKVGIQTTTDTDPTHHLFGVEASLVLLTYQDDDLSGPTNDCPSWILLPTGPRVAKEKNSQFSIFSITRAHNFQTLINQAKHDDVRFLLHFGISF